MKISKLPHKSQVPKHLMKKRKPSPRPNRHKNPTKAQKHQR
jgi:hypothetical protein